MTNAQRARLWDEINRYVATCGGDASKHVYGNTPRQVAVSQIEAIIREIEAAWANDMRQVAEADICGARCDYGSECLSLRGHEGGHETQHGCVFFDPPHVCPGCYAVGEEPHLSWCIDDELDREREEAIQRGDYDYTEEP